MFLVQFTKKFIQCEPLSQHRWFHLSDGRNNEMDAATDDASHCLMEDKGLALRHMLSLPSWRGSDLDPEADDCSTTPRTASASHITFDTLLEDDATACQLPSCKHHRNILCQSTPSPVY
jgi:hypothetical protein